MNNINLFKIINFNFFMIEFIRNNLSFFLFVIFITIFLLINKKKVEVQGPFPFLYMILYKTRLGLDKMSKWSKNHPKVFLNLARLSAFIGVVGIFISIVLMIYGIHFTLINNLGSGGGLVLPIKTESGMDGTVPIFYVPFFYWIIALFILVIVHEFAHGVIAERFNIKVKSSGFAFGGLILPLLPAAFVEPDEKKLKKASPFKQIAVLGAGSTSNFIFGFLFLAIWLFLLTPAVDKTYEINNIYFSNVMNQSDLTKYNITSGNLLQVNNISNKTRILSFLSNLTPNETLNLTINTSNLGVHTYTIKTFPREENKSKGMIGISGLNIDLKPKEKYSFMGNSLLYIEKLFYYLWMLNIGIGIMNLLPIWITDGGQITRVLLERKLRKKELALKLYNYISLFSLILIIFTIWPGTLITLLKLFGF